LPYVVWIATGLAWAGAFVVVRAGVSELPPFTFAALRTLLGALVLIVLAATFDGKNRPDARETRFWLLLGLPQIAIPYAALFWSAQYLPSGVTATLFATFPAFTAVASHFIIKDERLTIWKASGTVLAIVAVALMVNPAAGERALPVIPVVMVMIGVMFASAGAVVVRGHGRKTSTLWLTTFQVFSGAVVLAVLALIFERGQPLVVSTFTVSAVLYLSLIVTVGCYLGLFWLLKTLDATFVAMGTILETGLAVLLGAALLDEAVGSRGVMGLALVAVSVGLVSFKHARVTPNQ
jgi:drug/metabolite transporter (DMT)-like permease